MENNNNNSADKVKEGGSDQKKAPQAAKKPFSKPAFGKRPGGFRKGFKKNAKPRDEFEQKIVDLARVTRVMAGGKRMKFRACMVVGDKMGKVGVGVAKGVDVSSAITKSVAQAKKHLIEVPIINGTIPHEVVIKKNSSRLLIKPAKQGSGLKVGGVMRIVFELVGVKDVVGKIIGSNNKVNNSKALIEALDSFVPQAVEVAKRKSAKKKANKDKDTVKVIKMKPKTSGDTNNKEKKEIKK